MKSLKTERIWVNFDELIVPPMECAWLSSPDQQFPGHGCISFEVAGENDATVILKSTPGSRRWQHLPQACYTVIIGSNRNSRLKIERNGELTCEQGAEWATLKPHVFRKFWIHVGVGGSISVGSGDPACATRSVFRWEDPAPLDGLTSIGLSSWDRHLRYKNIRVDSEMPVSAGAWPSGGTQCAMPSLYDICVNTLLDDVTAETARRVLEVFACSMLPRGKEICEHAAGRLASQFEELSKDGGWFSELPCSTLVKVLKSSSLCAKERAIFKAISRWSYYGTKNPSPDTPIRSEEELHQLLPLIRFPVMEDTDLKDVLENPLAQKCTRLLELVEEAKSSWEIPTPIAVANRRQVVSLDMSKVMHQRFQPRLAPHTKQLVYCFDRDLQGVFYYLGTAYGTREWMNPMVAKRVRVQASCPPGRCTIAKMVVSKKFSKTNYATPRKENGRLAAWWLVDLIEHTLVCNYYTIRHDGSYDFMQNWTFQGSNDGEAWMDLRRHELDHTFHSPGQFASWSVKTETAYRMFRVLLTGPTTSTISPLNMCLSNLELYGTLFCPTVC